MHSHGDDQVMHTCDHGGPSDEAKRFKEIKIAQILEGDSRIGLSKGIVTMAEEYMDMNDWCEERQELVMKAFELLLARTNGQSPTPATFFRQIVNNHPSYNRDSIVSEDIIFEILNVVENMQLRQV